MENKIKVFFYGEDKSGGKAMKAFGKDLSQVECVYCGQCAAVCPTGAITPRSHIQEVWKAKDAISAKHHHDVRRLVEHLRAVEKSSGSRVVDLHARQHADSRTR